MAISEEARHRMYTRLETVLGAEEAATMMEHLPPVGWADVATRRDLDHHAAITRADLDGLRVVVKADIDGLRTEVKADIDRLRTEMTSEFGAVRSELEIGLARLDSKVTDKISTQTRTLIVANATMLAGIAGLAALLGR